MGKCEIGREPVNNQKRKTFFVFNVFNKSRFPWWEEGPKNQVKTIVETWKLKRAKCKSSNCSAINSNSNILQYFVTMTMILIQVSVSWWNGPVWLKLPSN